MVYGYIYVIENLVNGKFYIGQTIRPNTFERWKEHINRKKFLIGKAIQKYGNNNFVFLVIDEAKNQKELDELEELYICLFGSKTDVNGYNIKNGGSRGKNSQETRKKMRDSHKNRRNPMKDPIIAKKIQGKNHYLYKDVNNDTIKKLYNEGLSTKKIGDIMGCSPQTINRRLKKMKAPLRNLRDSHIKKSFFGFQKAEYKNPKNQNPWTRKWNAKISYKNHETSLGYFNDPLSAEIVYNLVRNEIGGMT